MLEFVGERHHAGQQVSRHMRPRAADYGRSVGFDDVFTESDICRAHAATVGSGAD